MIAQDISWMADNWARLLVAATSTTTTAIVARGYHVWRKGRSDDLKTEVDGDAGIREHWANELAALRAQIVTSGNAHAERAREAETRYRAGLRAADERHDAAMVAADAREAACQDEVRQLRAEVRAMADEIIGLRRQLAHGQRAAIVLATHAPSEIVADAAERAACALDQLADERAAS